MAVQAVPGPASDRRDGPTTRPETPRARVRSPGNERRAAELLHDLRNPVAAVRMVVTFVTEMPGDVRLSEVKDHLNLACSATDRAFELIGAVERELGEPADPTG